MTPAATDFDPESPPEEVAGGGPTVGSTDRLDADDEGGRRQEGARGPRVRQLRRERRFGCVRVDAGRQGDLEGRTLAASMVSVTASTATPISSATFSRSDSWTDAVKSDTWPAATTAAVTIDAVAIRARVRAAGAVTTGCHRRRRRHRHHTANIRGRMRLRPCCTY